MKIDKKFLLVCLQLIIVLLMSMTVEGMPALSQSSISPSNQQQPLSNVNERAFRLYNQCAFRYVLIQDNRVTATATQSDNRGDLILETMLKGSEMRIRIRGLTSGRYLCYNRRGRLVAKPKKKAKGAKCEFKEEAVIGHSWRYISAFNDEWFLGFDHKGRPLHHGHNDQLGTHQPSCFRFDKLAHIVTPRVSNNHINVDKHHSKLGQSHPHRPDFLFSYKDRRSTTTTTTTSSTTTPTPTTSTTTTTTPTPTTTPTSTTTIPTTISTTTTSTQSPQEIISPLTPTAEVSPTPNSENFPPPTPPPEDGDINPKTHHRIRHHNNHHRTNNSQGGKQGNLNMQKHLKKSQRNRKSKQASSTPSSLLSLPKTQTFSAAVSNR